jgi:uncharacterized protein
MTIIDAFCHVLPPKTWEAMEKLDRGFGWLSSQIRTNDQFRNLDQRFRVLDEFGDYRQIISLSSPTIEEVAGPSEGNIIARIANDEMAAMVDRYPERFPGFVASVSLHDVEASLAELDRAISQLGACGVQLPTEVDGRPIDDETFDTVFGFMHDRGLPIWLHPARTPATSDYLTEETSHFEMFQILGWPYATSVAMMRLVLTGLFDRYPAIRIITHHLGGMIPYHAARVERAALRISANKEAPGAERVKPLRRPPLTYLKQFYGDTAMHGSDAAVRCGLEFFGENRVLFATDHPFGSIQPAVDMMSRLNISEEARRKITRDNIVRLVGSRLKKI